MSRNSNDDTERRRGFPLVGSIQNSVGYGFVGNEAHVAVAHRLGSRTIAVPTAFASARGGIDHRMHLAIEERDFRRGVEFLLSREPLILTVGYLAHPNQVDIVVEALSRFAGLVVLDPVLGSYHRGLVVSEETARRIRDRLLPKAQVVTPNRFEAEVLLGFRPERDLSERGFLDGLAERGPETTMVTSFERDVERRQLRTLFSNG